MLLVGDLPDFVGFGSELAVSAYTRLRSTGVRYAFVSVVTVLALIWCIWKIVIQYKRGLESENGIDYKAIIGLLKPLLPFIAFIALFPIIINVIEILISHGERYIYNSVGFKTIDLDAIVRKEALRDGNPNKESEWGVDLSWDIGESLLNIWEMIRSTARVSLLFAMGLVDSYLYTIVLLLRYLWLILLEITAPIAILCLFMSDSDNNYKDIFTSWLRNLYSCYMLGAAFVVANFLAEGIRVYLWEKYDTDNIITILFVIIIKILLYGASRTYSSRLI